MCQDQQRLLFHVEHPMSVDSRIRGKRDNRPAARIALAAVVGVADSPALARIRQVGVVARDGRVAIVGLARNGIARSAIGA